MIGKAEWFKYRMFGWGVAPKTWQGWVYVAAAALILGLATSMTATGAIPPAIVGVVFAIFVADILHVMVQLPRVSDERENMHQLIIERNCSFAAIAALLGMAAWQSYQNKALWIGTSSMGIPFDTSIAVVLAAMLVTKIASAAYVKMKM
ncbi:hypothetical protein JW711_03290 [Candidatus Woesearchaeota archaeon]|nr:hypothetical protein [Candidatus Woesearchaeota archaeon]